MSRWKIRNRKTDYGTITLHWTLVVSLVVALVSGLRIATEAPDRAWINLLDRMLPSSSVWTAHMPAALVLVYGRCRLCDLYVALGPRPPRSARPRPNAWIVRQSARTLGRDQHRPILGVLRHLAVAARDRRPAIFRLHPSISLLRCTGLERGRFWLRRSARAGAFEARRKAATASHFPAGAPRASAAAARSDPAAHAAGRAHWTGDVTTDGDRADAGYGSDASARRPSAADAPARRGTTRSPCERPPVSPAATPT